MLGDRELNIHDYLAIARRRVWWLVLPTVIVPVLTFLVSLKIPNRYTSETTVLVDQQKVPDSFVKAVVTEDLNGRLATMQEQILSRTRLQPMIERFGLFKSDQGKVPMEELVDRMRKLITVTPIKANEATRRGDMPGFSISFTAENARLAQQICAEITSMFMSENLKAREQSAMGTTDFLSSQLDQAKRELDDQDSKLAQFKMKYTGQLPEQEQTNLSMLATLNSQLDATTQMLARAQQDKTYSESLLAQQTAAWQASSRTTANPDTLEHQLSALQSQLVTLQSKYTDDHPDIIKLKREIARLKKALSENASASDALSKDASKVGLTQPPELQQLRLQIHQLESVVKERSSEQQRLRQQIGLYQSRVQLSPKVEEEYKQLTRDYTTAQKFYDDLLNKKTQSEMATNLERRQQGEQFRVMDPPNLPETPTYPKRWQFAGFGVLGGLGFGLAAVVILEFRDKVVRTESDVEYYLKLPTLAMVPLVGAAAAHRAPKGKPRSSRAPSSARQVIGA